MHEKKQENSPAITLQHASITTVTFRMGTFVLDSEPTA
jgi:hypothetical protein